MNSGNLGDIVEQNTQRGEMTIAGRTWMNPENQRTLARIKGEEHLDQ